MVEPTSLSSTLMKVKELLREKQFKSQGKKKKKLVQGVLNEGHNGNLIKGQHMIQNKATKRHVFEGNLNASS